MRNSFRMAVAALGMILASMTAAAADGAAHKLVFHVDENDPAVMNLTLNNVANVIKHYQAVGQSVAVEVVTYGPGLTMLRSDTSPVKDRISTMSLEYQGSLAFAACGNTIKGVTKKEGAAPPIMDEAMVVEAGVVRLVELQEQGYSYIRP